MERSKRERLQNIGIWIPVILCTLVLVTLCFDEGLDYDEAYSWHTVHDNSFTGVWKAVLDAHDTDIPLWYWSLKVWVTVFGESWFAYKLFSVVGTLGTMILGATVVRRLWGMKTSLLFILPVGLSPALMHASVNVRMYSWTVFLVTACGLLVYWMGNRTRKLWMWVLLGLLTAIGLFCHYFTAFCYLFLYFYLLIRIFLQNKKEIWKVFACGAGALIPFIVWLVISDFFHLASGGSTPGVSKTDLWSLFQYFFGTEIEYATHLGILVFLIALCGVVLLRNRFQKAESGFVLICLIMSPITCVVMGYVSSLSFHFFIPRHIMHGVALMWLGIAIVLSRINVASYLCALIYMITMGISSYSVSYDTEYGTIPYLEETKELIAEEMQPGDIIIYNAEPSYESVYSYYIREQILCHVSRVGELREYAGKRVWFFDGTGIYLTEEQKAGCELAYESIGHYGFRLSGNHTDFDVYRLEIGVKEP